MKFIEIVSKEARSVINLSAIEMIEIDRGSLKISFGRETIAFYADDVDINALYDHLILNMNNVETYRVEMSAQTALDS